MSRLLNDDLRLGKIRLFRRFAFLGVTCCFTILVNVDSLRNGTYAHRISLQTVSFPLHMGHGREAQRPCYSKMVHSPEMLGKIWHHPFGDVHGTMFFFGDRQMLQLSG